MSGRWFCQAHVHDSGQTNPGICEPSLGIVHEGWRSCTRTTSTVRGQSNGQEGTASGIKLCGPGNDWVANTGLEKTTSEVSSAVETVALSWATSSAGTAANLCFCMHQAVLAKGHTGYASLEDTAKIAVFPTIIGCTLEFSSQFCIVLYFCVLFPRLLRQSSN